MSKSFCYWSEMYQMNHNMDNARKREKKLEILDGP